MSDLEGIGTPKGDETDAEQAVRFRIPVTWSSLLNPAALVRLGDNTRAVTPHDAASSSTVQWSMVVPKLPTPVATVHLLPVPSGQAAQFPAPRYVVPKFEVSSDSVSLTVKVLLSAAVALLLAPGWTNNGSPGARALEVESTMSERGWIRVPASPASSSRIARQLVLYRSSLSATDYRIEFTWRVNPQGVAWVFRATDNDNYYAVRVRPLGPESSRTFSVERFTVYRGSEKSGAQKALTLPGTDSSLRVRMDVAGSIFRLYLEGVPVSKWTDTRLSSGGIGFLEEGNKPAEVQSVRIISPVQ